MKIAIKGIILVVLCALVSTTSIKRKVHHKSKLMSNSYLRAKTAYTSKFNKNLLTSWDFNQWYKSYINFNGIESEGMKFSTHDLDFPTWNQAAKKGIALSSDACAWYPWIVRWQKYCYIPYRTMDTIKFSDEGYNHSFFFSSKEKEIKVYMPWWAEDIAKEVINLWNNNRNTRKNLLGQVIQQASGYAQTYKQNVELYNTASTSVVDIQSQINSQIVLIQNTKNKIVAKNNEIRSAQNNIATATTELNQIIENQNQIKVKIDSNEYSISQLENVVKELSEQDSTNAKTREYYVKLKEEDYAELNNLIISLKTEVHEESTNLDSAFNNIISGNPENCLQILRNIQPIG